MIRKLVITLSFVALAVTAMATQLPTQEQHVLHVKQFDQHSSVLVADDQPFSMGSVTYEAGEYHRIISDLEGQIRLIGAPELPSATQLVAVPASGDVRANFSYRNVRVETGVNLVPFQPVQLEAQNLADEFHMDEDIYSTNAWYPESPVILHDRMVMRDLTVVGVEVTPFQYNPVTKELRVYEGLEVTVDHDDALTTPQRPISRFFEPLYRNMVPNSVLVMEPEYQTPSVLYIYTPNATVEMLLGSLIEWRHEKGFEANMVSTTVTGTSNSSIKSYIQTAYNTWENPPEFVVLVGDAGGTFNIPTWTESWSGYSGPGDLPYVQLAGLDNVADAFVGRLPFGSTTEFANIIAKIINYEKAPYMADPTWFTRALLVGDPSSSGLSTEMTNRNINEYMMPHGFTNNIQVYSGSWVSQIASGINSGVSYFNYRGYLGMSGWGNTNTSALTNGSQLPFVTILTCGTGTFTSDSRSEQFLRVGSTSVPKGGIAAVGTATSGTHTLYNNCVSVGIHAGIWMDDLHYAGPAVERGRLNLHATYPSNPNNYVDIFSHWNNLMGDPSLELWTGVPQDLSVDVMETIPSNAQFLEVNVSDDFGVGLEKAWVTLTGAGVFVSAYTDMDGYAALELPATLPTGMTLTVTRHNAIPEQIDIDVDDIYPLSITNVTVEDGSGSEELNPGDDFSVNLEFANITDSTLTGIDFFVMLEDGSEVPSTLGSLTAGSSASYGSELYSFSLPADYPSIGRLDMTITLDAAGMTFIDHRRFDVVAPYVQIDVAGESGSGPYSFDPGEVADLVLYSTNIGNMASSNMTAILRTNNPNVEILDSTATFTDAEAGAETDNSAAPFSISIDTQVTIGVQIPFQVELTDDSGFVQRIAFQLHIGTPSQEDPTGPDAGGYFCYSDQDLAYAMAPTYDWIEIAPGQGGYAGTLLDISDYGSNQEDIRTVTLPFNFGFYGVDYNQVSICSNGYVGLGASQTALFRNYPIPGPMGPSPMIAPFWDDLVQGSNGNVYTYYNSAEHYFVIEYFSMENAFSGSEETFQIILFDGDYYGSTDGNGDIKIQYQTYNNDNPGTTWSSSHGQYSTTGIEDHTSHVGIQYTYNNSYAPTAHEITDGTALLFTTRTDAILPCPGWARGDINHDGQRNVQDLVIQVQAILGTTTVGDCEFWAADMSYDSTLSVSDVVLLVNEVLGFSGLGRDESTAGTAELIIDGSSVQIKSREGAAAFAFTIKGDARPSFSSQDGLTIVTHDRGYEMRVLGYWTRTPEREMELMTFPSGEFAIEDLEAADGAGVLMKSQVVEMPSSFELTSVYPNPFNPSVNISYALPRQEMVSIRIFNALGQEVNAIEQDQVAGQHMYTWNGNNQAGLSVSSGVYFARIQAGDAQEMIKLTLLR